MNAFTARVLEPGSAYFDPRRERIVHVPLSHYAIACQACSDTVLVPRRQGRDRAEKLRRDHLLSAHLTQVGTGAVVLTPVPGVFVVPELAASES